MYIAILELLKIVHFFIAEIVYDAKPCIVGLIDFSDSETQANALSF